MSSFSNAGIVSPDGENCRCASAEPSALLVRFSDLLPRTGLAVDLACGYGRNTLYLARLGLAAIGVDRSLGALMSGREASARANLRTSFVQADLTRFALPADAFSVIIGFKYRDRNWYPSIRTSLRPGGLLIYETYTAEHLMFGHKPFDPAHLLDRNELLKAFEDWEIVFYREVWVGSGLASLVARKPGRQV